MLTEQQQAAIEADIENYTSHNLIIPSVKKVFSYGYKTCAYDILTNPKKYGLMPVPPK